MVKYIINLLGIDVLPKWLLTHFLLMSFALGGFNAIFFIEAVTGFLAGGQILFFPEIVILSGIIGLLLYNLYKYYDRKFSSSYAWMMFWIVVVVLLSMSVILPFFTTFFSKPAILLTLYIPITVIANLFFLQLVGNLPILKENQNLKRFLDSGLMVGAAFFSFVITFLTVMEVQIPSLATLVVFSIIVVAEYFFIVRQLDFKENKVEEVALDSMISILAEISPKKVVFSAIMFCVFSTVNFIFVEFSFFSVIRNVFTDASNLLKFVGFFFGSVMMVNLVLKVFVYQNLIKTFRISRAFFLSPIFFIAILTLLNIVLLNPSNAIVSSPFTFMFLLVLFSRFFAFLLRETFENLSLRQYLVSIEVFNKRLLSANILHVIGFWSLLLGGLMLLMLLALEIKSFSFILKFNLLIAVFWLLGTYWTWANYSQNIKRVVERLTSDFKPNRFARQKSFKDRVMISTNLSGMRYLLNYQRHYQPNNFLKTIEAIPNGIKAKLEIFKPGELANSPSLIDVAEEAVPSMHFYDAEDNDKDSDVEALATSHRVKDRIHAVKTIQRLKDPGYFNILKMLLRDYDDEVKRNAIIALATFYNNELINDLLEYVNHEDFSDLSSDVLTTIGPDAVEPLITMFYSAGLEFKQQVKIIKILGKISGEKARKFLLEIISYPNKWIVLEVVNSLNESNYKATTNENELVNSVIENTIGAAAWLLTMEASIEPLGRLTPVKRALGEEYLVNLDLVFKLLTLKYSEGVVEQVRVNLENYSNNEQRELSVELLDTLLEKDIKKFLFPLLHNNRLNEKIFQLSRLFPVSLVSPLQALKEIVNADLGKVSLWTKACALQVFIDTVDNPSSEDVFSQVFNPEPLLSEIAFFGILKRDPSLAPDLYNRLPKKAKKHVGAILATGNKFDYKLLYNKVLSLQKIGYFEKVKGHHLLPFAQILSEIFVPAGESIFLQCSEDEVLPVFIVPHGEVSLIDLHKRAFRLNRNYLYGLGLYAGGIKLSAFSDSVIYLAKPDQIGSLVINYEELSDALYKYIQNSNFY